MANLTKEERAKRESEKDEQIRKEIEEQVRSEIGNSELNDLELKKENNELKNQLSQMMEMIKSLKDEKSFPKTDDTYKSNPDVAPVEMNERILITSMTNGGVNMKTSNDGTARHFRLEKIGQTIPIIYEHLINCINTDRWLFEDGLVYIHDEKVVKEQVLENCYQKFLTPDKIENIMDFDILTVSNMVENTTPTIQETIATLIAEKMNRGGTIDMNKVEAIGNVCTPKIDIRELANKLK